MNLNEQYIHPQLAAALLYAQAKGKYTDPFTKLSVTSSSLSHIKTGRTSTCRQSVAIEFETHEPYQTACFRMDVDLCDKDAHIQMIGKGFHDIYVFPSDADALELWLVQFKFYLRSEFAKDNTKDNTND
jgi:hypothetical protein